MNSIGLFIKNLGLLRIGLISMVLFSMLFRPAPVLDPVYEGWGILFHMLLPVLAPIMLMLLLLDALMSAVHMADKQGEARTRYRHILQLNLLLAILMAIRWVPYYIAINQVP